MNGNFDQGAKRIQFCILIGKRENELKSCIPDTRTDCIRLTIISSQCCVLVILMHIYIYIYIYIYIRER